MNLPAKIPPLSADDYLAGEPLSARLPRGGFGHWRIPGHPLRADAAFQGNTSRSHEQSLRYVPSASLIQPQRRYRLAGTPGRPPGLTLSRRPPAEGLVDARSFSYNKESLL